MGAKVTRGNGATDESMVSGAFAAEGLTPTSWSNAPGDRYAVHSHAYHKVLYCLRGSITFTLPDGAGDVALAAGDRLEIEPGTRHGAFVGAEGVTCMEAPRT